ncbi:MAG: TROVE domain-containing protein [Promethearchaeota archaeon]
MVKKTKKITSKLGGFKKEYKKADHLSEAGAPSFSQPLELMTLQNLLCNIIEPSYYISNTKLLEQSYQIYNKMVQKDSHLFAQMIVYTRNNGYMRLQPILALVYLSKFAPELFQKIFNHTIHTPKDLHDFINLCKAGRPRKGLGRRLKTTIKTWLNDKVSEYWAIKYPKELIIAAKMVHLTSLEDVKKQNIFDYLFDFRKGETETILKKNTQLVAWENLKATDDPAKILALIKSGHLPYEAVTGTVNPERDGWKALMHQMPFFALLRHLATLERNEIFQNPENIIYVTQRLTNKDVIAKSKILPFRFFEAWKYAKKLPFEIVTALETALELAFINMPIINKQMLIGTDVSGSMTSLVSRRIGKKWRKLGYRFIDIAGIFTGALWKQNKMNTLIIPFDTKSHKFNPTEFSNIMEMTNWFSSIRGGGTDLGIPLKVMLQQKIKVDLFIGITDNEDWAGYGVANDLKKYRDTINPDLKAFLLRIDPYTHDVAYDLKHPQNYILSGWSNQIPQLIAFILEGQSQLDFVKKIKI